MLRSTAALNASIVIAFLTSAPSHAREITTFDTRVPGCDGIEVPITVYRAVGLAEAPTLLWGPGFSAPRFFADYEGPRGSTVFDMMPPARFYARHGYNVVAMDLRGHGEQFGVTFFSPRYVCDTSRVIDWIADQGWASRACDEGSGDAGACRDPVLGALGASQGGIYQLLTAARDDRVDAIAPEVTTPDLITSVLPNGVERSVWLGFFCAAGNALIWMRPEERACLCGAAAPGEYDLLEGALGCIEIFEQLSLSEDPGRVEVPTLLVQGIPDTAFILNDAMAAAERVVADGGAVEIYTHLSGHIASAGIALAPLGLIPFPQPGAPDVPYPCGDPDEHILSFFDEALRDDPPDVARPRVMVALDDETCVTSDEIPELLDAGLVEVSLDEQVTVLQGAPLPVSVRIELVHNDADDDDLIIAGIPTLSARVDTALAPGGAHLFFALSKVDALGRSEVVDYQFMPMRVEHSLRARYISLDLAGVAARLEPGESLGLEIAPVSPIFITEYEIVPGVARVSRIEVGLPLLRCGRGVAAGGGFGKCRRFEAEHDPSLSLLPGLW